MKKRNNLALKYLEGIIYCVMLLISVMFCISGDTYIKMIPIAFISGIIGQMLLGKKAMTSIFSCILSLVVLQIKTPALFTQNVISTVIIVVLSLIGELCGFSLKKLIHLVKLKSTKRREKEKLKHYLMCSITMVMAITINSIFNGNPISYFRCKNNLKNYFINEYSSGSRFKVFSSRYTLENKAKYTFYTKDLLRNDEIGKFTVYLDDEQTIQDEYKQKILNKTINDITSNLSVIEEIPKTNVTLTCEDTNIITINFIKEVENVTSEEIEEYAKQIANYIKEAKKISSFNNVKEIKIVLESKANTKDGLATIIYMDGYNDMLEKNLEQDYDYIKRALNIEYID